MDKLCVWTVEDGLVYNEGACSSLCDHKCLRLVMRRSIDSSDLTSIRMHNISFILFYVAEAVPIKSISSSHNPILSVNEAILFDETSSVERTPRRNNLSVTTSNIIKTTISTEIFYAMSEFHHQVSLLLSQHFNTSICHYYLFHCIHTVVLSL